MKDINTFRDLDGLECSQFIECRVVLRKNPLVDSLEGIKKLLELFTPFMSDSNKGASGRPARGQGDKDKNRAMTRQLESVLTSLKQSDSLELIGEVVGASGLRIVLSTRPEYFSDKDALDIIDGEYSLLGKVVRVVDAQSEDSINLLRKTTFGRFDREMIARLSSGFATAADYGLKFPEVVTEIEGPALQVLPIAIFT